jgi:hypothetical protein
MARFRRIYGDSASSYGAIFAPHIPPQQTTDIAILVEKAAGFVDVGAKEGCSYQGNSHDFGGGEPNLGIVEAMHGLQEVLTQAVDGDYGIVDHILPIQRRLGVLRIGRILLSG